MAQSKPWTAEEDQVVIEAAQRGKTVAETAELLPERTPAAVRCRRPMLDDQIRSPASGLTRQQMEEAVYQYTYQGLGKTAQQVATALSVPVQALKSEFRARGITKHSPPVLSEQIPEAPEEQERMAQRISARRSADFSKRLDEVDAKTLRRENRKLQEKLDDKEYVLRLWGERLGEVELSEPPPVVSPSPPGVYDYIMETSDPHFGKEVNGLECFGKDYNISEACRRFNAASDWMADRLFLARGGCRNLHLAALGDEFHAPLLETEHGTQLERQGSDLEVIDAYMQARHYQIARAREVSERVHVRMTPGNHGHVFESMAQRELKAYYRNVDDVTVHYHPRRYDTFIVGSTAFMLDHGYGINKLDTPSSQVKLTNTLRATLGDDFHRVTFTYILMGHKHTEGVAAFGRHSKAIRFDAMCEPGDWESERRYDGEASVSLMRLSDEGRITDTHRHIF